MIRSSDTGWGAYEAIEPGDYELRLFQYPCGRQVYFADETYVRQHLPLRVTIRSGERVERAIRIDRHMIKAASSYENPAGQSCSQ